MSQIIHNLLIGNGTEINNGQIIGFNFITIISLGLNSCALEKCKTYSSIRNKENTNIDRLLEMRALLLCRFLTSSVQNIRKASVSNLQS
jgi:hypothetical protein